MTVGADAYSLGLMALAGGTCPASALRFGHNRGAVMSYMLVGTTR